MSYYDLLSIASTATTEEVKKAYRKKALQLHPDRYSYVVCSLAPEYAQLTLVPPVRNPQGQQDGHKEFKAVSEAYEVVYAAVCFSSWCYNSVPALQCRQVESVCVQVLKDPGKRATYDAIKDGFPGRRNSPYSAGTATYTETSYTYYKPDGGTPEQDPFDEFFAKWWAKREHE